MMKTLVNSILAALIILSACRNASKSNTEENSGSPKSDSVASVPNPELKTGEIAVTDDAFGDVIELKGEQITTNQVFKIAETEMLVKDSLMIMKNYSNDFQFKIFRLPEFKLLKSFGKSGRGPDEFQFARLVKSEDKNTLCFIYEITNSKLYKVDRQLNMSPAAVKFAEKKPMFDEKQLYSFSDHDFYYVGNNNAGKSIYHITERGDSIKTNEVYNLAFSSGHRNWANYIGDFGANRSRGRLVYAYKYFKRLIFMDTTATKVRILNFQKDDAQKKEVLAQLGPENVTHYWGMSSQPDYVYVLYSGRTPLEVSKQFKHEDYYIFVEQFDWNGNPVRKYRLDHWGYFCVDEKSNSIYIASVNDDEPMFRYKLK
jgi:hypothetical protein